MLWPKLYKYLFVKYIHTYFVTKQKCTKCKYTLKKIFVCNSEFFKTKLTYNILLFGVFSWGSKHYAKYPRPWWSYSHKFGFEWLLQRLPSYRSVDCCNLHLPVFLRLPVRYVLSTKLNNNMLLKTNNNTLYSTCYVQSRDLEMLHLQYTAALGV